MWDCQHKLILIMKITLHLFVFLSALMSHTLTSQVNIQGEATIAVIGFPAPFVEIQIVAEAAGIDTSVTTNIEGQFNLELDLEPGITIDFKTIDFCSGDELVESKLWWMITYLFILHFVHWINFPVQLFLNGLRYLDWMCNLLTCPVWT